MTWKKVLKGYPLSEENEMRERYYKLIEDIYGRKYKNTELMHFSAYGPKQYEMIRERIDELILQLGSKDNLSQKERRMLDGLRRIWKRYGIMG